MKIQLGDEVKHIYTGFKGIATARTTYLSGCDRIIITPKVKKDGTLSEAMNFDEPEIKLIKRGNPPKIKNGEKTGGWQPKVRHYLKN